MPESGEGLSEPRVVDGITQERLYTLRRILRNPGDYIERRVDTIKEIGTGHIRWSSRIQYLVPYLPVATEGATPPESAVQSEPADLERNTAPVIVSLGVFSKQRLPDLVAHNRRGEQVPILGRRTQIEVLTVSLVQDLVLALDTPAQRELLLMAQEVLSAPKDLAENALSRLADTARDAFETVGSEQLADRYVEVLVGRLQPFTNLTQVLAWVEPTKSGRAMLSIDFTTSHRFPGYSSLRAQHKRSNKAREAASRSRNAHSDVSAGEHAPRGAGDTPLTAAAAHPEDRQAEDNKLWAWYRLLLMNFGLLAVPLSIRLSGANHCHSYYAIVEAPTGTEVESLYWKEMAFLEAGVHRSSGGLSESSEDAPDSRPGRDSAAPTSPAASGESGDVNDSRGAADAPTMMPYESQSGQHPALACFYLTHEVKRQGMARLNLRIRRERVWRLFMLVVLIGCVSLFVMQNVANEERLSSAAAWTTAVAGASLAVIGERSSDLFRHLGRYLRRGTLAVSASAVLLGARIGVSGIEDSTRWWNHPVTIFQKSSVFGVAAVTGALALFMAVVLGAIVIRRRPPLEAADDPYHATYDTYRRYRHARRVVAAVAFAVALVGMSVVVIRYRVPELLFSDAPTPGTTRACTVSEIPQFLRVDFAERRLLFAITVDCD